MNNSSQHLRLVSNTTTHRHLKVLQLLRPPLILSHFRGEELLQFPDLCRVEDVLVCRVVDVLVCRVEDVLVCRVVDVLVWRVADVLVCRVVDVLVCRVADVLVYSLIIPPPCIPCSLVFRPH